VYLSGALPPSVSALNSTVSGALPSSGSPSAHARRGDSSSSSPSPLATVVVGPPAAGAGAAAGGGAGPVAARCGGSPFPPPAPHPRGARRWGGRGGRPGSRARIFHLGPRVVGAAPAGP